MDLAKLNLVEFANGSQKMRVVHPVTGDILTTNNGEEVYIELLGADSSKMRSEMSDRARKQIAKRNSTISTIEEAEKASSELLAAITVSWFGIEENGQFLECTKENAIAIYTKYSWLRLQVDAFVSDRANFYKA